MLLVNVGIVISAYIGTRFVEYCSNKKFLPQVNFWNKKIPKSYQSATPTENDGNQSLHSMEKKHDHYFKMSAVAMGLAIISVIYPPLTLLNIGVIVYITLPILREAEKSLLEERRIKNDLLVSLLNIMALAIGQYLAAALEAWLYHFGSKLLSKSKDKTTQMLTDVFEQQPSKVWVLKNGQEIETPLELLEVGDIVVVKAGEVIPVDGVISNGLAMIDQHALTGEDMPAEKGIGDQIFAATVVVSGHIYLKVEKTGHETTVAKLGEILNHTANFKTNLQLLGEKWADRTAAPLISLSFLSFPFIGASSAAAILNSAPTNSIRITTSLHTLNHLTLVSNKGILVKDGHALEELTQIDTVLFDKTGTLTTGEPEVGRIICCDDLGETEILAYAAAAENRLTHPIAHAIVNKAQEQFVNLPDISEASYQIGYGVTVSFNNMIIKVGSIRFMTMEGIVLPPIIEELSQHSQEEGHSLVMVAINDQLKGAIEMQAQVRPEVTRVLKGLRQRGIKQIAIVSGDHKYPTQTLAETLGMDNYFYEVLPQDKANIVEQLQKAGHKVCFIGDGINDAIAMKKADVSISLRGASSIATDMAQVVLMDGSLSNLCDIFDISKQLNTNLQHNLLLWVAFGAINLTGALVFRVSILKANAIFAVIFGLGMAHAMLPLRQLEPTKTTKPSPVLKTNEA